MRRKPNEMIIIVAGINSHGLTMALITITDTTCKKPCNKIILNRIGFAVKIERNGWLKLENDIQNTGKDSLCSH